MPEEVKIFMQQHQLVRPEDFAAESQLGVQLTLPSVIQLVLTSFSELAGQASGREVLWNMARETTDTPGSDGGRAGAAIAPSHSTGIIKSVLDDRYHGSVNAIAAKGGLQQTSVVHLIEAVTTAVLGILGALVVEQHWNAQQLGEWLRPNQAAAAAPFVLPGLSAATTFPFNPSGEATAPGIATKSWLSANTNKLLVAMTVLAAAEFGYILSTRPNSQSEAVPVAAVAAPESRTDLASPSGQYTARTVSNVTSTAPATAVTSSELAVPVVLKLKDGLRQINAANSTESKLYEFLIDQSQEVDLVDPSKGWIGFDRIYFESNKAILTNESLWQLSNVASILKRFPAAKIKVGGYTDSSGNPLVNLRLSKERAQAAMASLISLGVPADHVVAVGYGALDNIATNDTEEGRALNRRVSMQVIQK